MKKFSFFLLLLSFFCLPGFAINSEIVRCPDPNTPLPQDNNQSLNDQLSHGWSLAGTGQWYYTAANDDTGLNANPSFFGNMGIRDIENLTLPADPNPHLSGGEAFIYPTDDSLIVEVDCVYQINNPELCDDNCPTGNRAATLRYFLSPVDLHNCERLDDKSFECIIPGVVPPASQR